MKCACSFTPVLALVGLVGLGLGGFNLMSTGCPLGHCKDKAPAQSAVVPVANTDEVMPCCEGADVAKTAALNKECAASNCDVKNCEEKLANGECPHATKSADGTTTCPMHPDASKTADGTSKCPMHSESEKVASK